jgi:proton-dependent oligopeptide transporter, POT family
MRMVKQSRPAGDIVSNIAESVTLPVDADSARRDLFGQPRGLSFLSATIFWDAFAMYGPQAVMLLYMVEHLLLPGHVEAIIGLSSFRHMIESVTGPLSTQALAAQIFGLFAGLVRFTPVFGGLIGDRWLGRRNTIAVGCMLMAAGNFALASEPAFLIGLLLMILGAGCIGSNIQSQVGALYGPGDRRRDDGFQIYYLLLNIGAFVAPIIAGWQAVAFDWHVTFVTAGAGMLAGLGVYQMGGSSMAPDPAPRTRTTAPRLAPTERRAVAVLLGLVPLMALFWVAQSQVWNVYNLWVRDHVDLTIDGWTMPVPWLQALDALAPALLLPPILWLWRVQARRGSEPSDIGKMALGCAIFGAGTVWLAAASWVFGDGARVPLLWAVGFHFLSNAGWVFFVPISVALFARAAPAKVNAMMLGINSTAVFIGSTASGRLGGLYETLTPSAFWLLHAAVVGAGAMVFAVLDRPLRNILVRTAGGEA